jgi:hypothetical protein
MQLTLKGVAIGFLLGSAAAAIAATVTNPYLNNGTAMTPGHVVIASSDGLGIQDGGTILARHYDASWMPGMSLATTVTLGQTPVAGTITGIACTPDIVAGGSATIAVWKAPNGTALGAGTKLNTTDCNANTGATTAQDMGVASSAISAGDRIGIIGAGWGTTNGSGNIRIAMQQN